MYGALITALSLGAIREPFHSMASAISSRSLLKARKIRYMASRNEYSKKRLGEISTAAYNTSLENTKYRNRYCNYLIDLKTNSPHSNVC